MNIHFTEELEKTAGLGEAMSGISRAASSLAKGIGGTGKLMFKYPKATLGIGAGIGAGILADEFINTNFRVLQTMSESTKRDRMNETNDLLRELINKDSGNAKADIATPKYNPVRMKIQMPLI